MKYNIFKNKGFSLIELIITIGIVAILTQFSFYIYTIYLVRSQVSESFVILSNFKNAITNYYNDKGVFPNNVEEINLTNFQGKYISNINIQNNSDSLDLQVIFGNQANLRISGRTILFESQENDKGNLIWNCKKGTIDSIYLPSICEK